MSNLIQTELDLFEEHLLTCLFKDINNPQFNSTVKSFLVMSGKNPIDILNEAIIKFENIAKPFLKDNGYVDGTKLSKLLEIRFKQQIPISDFRLIDVSRILEPWLITLGTLIQ